MKSKFTKNIQQVLDSLKTPGDIQKYIDQEITYDPYREDRTLEEVIADKKGECYNGAMLALAGLQNLGYETGLVLLFPFEDEEHILAVYNINGKWGSIAQSKFLGLKSREPIYLTIHDLAVSYMEFYYSFDGFYSLSGHSELFEVTKYHNHWVNNRETVVMMEKDLLSSKIIDLMGEKTKTYVSPQRYWKEIDFIPKETVIPDRYLKFKPKL